MSIPIPNGYNDIIGALSAWGKSGLISGRTVIKSYHAPIIDNVTGVQTLVPATVYKSSISTDAVATAIANSFSSDVPEIGYRKIEYSSIDELPNAVGYSGSNVVDFNQNDIPYGLDTTVAIGNTKNGYRISQVALSTNDEEQYRESLDVLVAETIGDRIAKAVELEAPKKVIDTLDDAKAFFKTQPLVEKTIDNEDNPPGIDTRREIPRRYELITTGVPCAIPGVLNCHLAIYDNVDVAPVNVEYTLQETVTYINPDPTDFADQEYTITDPYILFGNRD